MIIIINFFDIIAHYVTFKLLPKHQLYQEWEPLTL
jgi:hypothetical protein